MPSKRALYGDEIDLEFVVIDATESPCQRPKKKQREYYSGKKRQYTLKGQIVINKNERILCAHTTKGTVHDFKLFKQSKPQTCIYVDFGYLGIKKLHENVQIPYKASKLHPLSTKQKSENVEKFCSYLCGTC
ncbi:MAG: transposase family protein [Sulfurimonas sp.]